MVRYQHSKISTPEIIQIKSGDTDIAPNKKEIKKFWKAIQSVETKHKPRVSWIRKVRTKMGTAQKQEDLSKNVKDVRSVLRKAAGPDGVQGF